MFSKSLVLATQDSPEIIDKPSAWLGHLPFASWIVQEVSPTILVELGCHFGHSYFSFCHSIKNHDLETKSYAVDTWQGDEHAGKYSDDLYLSVHAYNHEHFSAFSRLLKMTFDEGATYFSDESIELLHIDGFHTYEAVKHDFETWLPKLAPGAVVLFHDINVRERNFGVWQYWEELQRIYPNNLEFLHSHGLGVLQLNNAPAEKSIVWLNKNYAEKPTIIKYFNSLGTNSEKRYEIKDLYKIIAERSAEIQNLASQKSVLQNTITQLEQEKEAINLEYKNVEQKYNDVEQKYKILEQKLSENISRGVVMNQEIASLSNTINTLQNNLANINGMNEKLEQEIIKNLDRERMEKDANAKNINIMIKNYEINIEDRDKVINEILHSSSWKITSPLRKISNTYKQAKRGFRLLKPAINHGKGFRKTLVKAYRILKNERINGLLRVYQMLESKNNPINIINGDENELANRMEPYSKELSYQAEKIFHPKILIVAELSIPQCKKYRVEQKKQLLEMLGYTCTIVNWHDTPRCLEALQTHSLVIFYRVPAFESFQHIINEARRLKLITVWEVDDYIFNRDLLAISKTVNQLDKNIISQLLDGADLYKNAMLQCDYGIASTHGLAEAMKNDGVENTFIIENALDHETLAIANKILSQAKVNNSDVVRIVYGSGTNTHNVDFLEASSAVLKILSANKNATLRIIGLLDLPDAFNQFADQIEKIKLSNYEDYLKSLSECDISLAPLEKFIFNDAKSNIKYLEASILKIPSVCSPRSAFKEVIENGHNGFLCDHESEWVEALTKLVADQNTRLEMGKKAQATVLSKYSPEIIASKQVGDFINHLFNARIKPNILSVNCLYSPRSFGGATIVAEENNKIINSIGDYQVHVFTLIPNTIIPPYAIKRYERDGVNIYGVGQPEIGDSEKNHQNLKIVQSFQEVVSVVKPAIVHFHSMQDIGVDVINWCHENGIKYTVTLHDAWWICGRQFMINNHGKYCNQQKLDREICGQCIGNKNGNDQRTLYLASVLNKAEVILSPSEFFADLYRKNGFQNIKVNKNGVTKPAINIRRKRAGAIVFGYVGGNTTIKGYHLVKEAFKALSNDPVKLMIVDNCINLGYSSFQPIDLEGLRHAEITPAYTQNNIDEFFKNIDVLLFPTQCKESFGLTVREALVRNVWVISTDAGGVVEDIKDDINGYIIPFDDTGAELKAAMIKTIERFSNINRDEVIDLPKNTISFFEDQAQALNDIYTSIIGRSAG